MISRPLFDTGFQFNDPDCDLLALEIYQEVNETFADVLGSEKAIKTYRAFNDNFVPLIDFPLLKVYKDAEQEVEANSELFITSIVVNYALAFTQEPKIGDVSTFVSKEIRRVIKNMSEAGKIQVDWSKSLTIDYEDFIDPKNIIYKYATLRFSIYTSPSSICQAQPECPC